MAGFGGNHGTASLFAFVVMTLGLVFGIWGLASMMHASFSIKATYDTYGGTLTLDEGSNTVFYEMDDGRSPSAAVLAERLRISDANNRKIPVEIAESNESVRTLTRNLTGLLTLEVPRDGDYTVEVEDTSSLPLGRVAIGPGLSFGRTWIFLWATVIGAILTLGGMIAIFALAVAAMRKGPLAAGEDDPWQTSPATVPDDDMPPPSSSL